MTAGLRRETAPQATTGCREARARPRRVCVVGPVAPYRSGVAKHTTELARNLAQRDDLDLLVLSFRRLYPRLLYPGEDDREGAAAAGLRVVERLDSVNPATWLQAARTVRRFAPDLAIFPAWTFFLAPCLGWVARACRRAGIPTVMIVHNLVDHESAGWKAALMRHQLCQADRFVTHGRALAEGLRAMLPGRPVAVRPHPIFGHYPPAEGRLARTAPLELLFFGLVRAYKGLDIALRGLAASGRRDARLTIVGEVWEGRAEVERLIAELGLAAQVEMVPRYVSDAEAAEYFARADAVLLPYRSVTGSGVVPVAYRYGKPVIVTDLPGLTEVVRDRATGWVVAPDDPAALGRLLSREVSAERAAAMRPAIEAQCAEMGWERFADLVLRPD